MFEHCVSEPPTVVQLQNRFQGVGKGRSIVLFEDFFLVPKDRSISLGSLGGLLMSLDTDLLKDLGLLTLIVLIRLTTTHV